MVYASGKENERYRGNDNFHSKGFLFDRIFANAVAELIYEFRKKLLLESEIPGTSPGITIKGDCARGMTNKENCARGMTNKENCARGMTLQGKIVK